MRKVGTRDMWKWVTRRASKRTREAVNNRKRVIEATIMRFQNLYFTQNWESDELYGFLILCVVILGERACGDLVGCG
jgi:hypothetical protein